MNETSWFLRDLDTNNIAIPYDWDGNNNIPLNNYGCTFYPAVQLRTSALQLAHFLIAFMEATILERPTITQ